MLESEFGCKRKRSWEGLIVDPSLKPRFIGMTPELPGARHVYEGRQQECHLWLNHNHASDGSWLAIDDVAGNFTYGSPHLILIEHRTGLTVPPD